MIPAFAFVMSISTGAAGLGLLFDRGLAIELGILGAALQFSKMALLAHLVRERVTGALHVAGLALIYAETILIGLAVFAVAATATRVVVMPPPLDGFEMAFRFAFVSVSVFGDPLAMMMMADINSRAKRRRA